jgi:hypothetical protein
MAGCSVGDLVLGLAAECALACFGDDELEYAGERDALQFRDLGSTRAALASSRLRWCWLGGLTSRAGRHQPIEFFLEVLVQVGDELLLRLEVVVDRLLGDFEVVRKFVEV